MKVFLLLISFLYVIHGNSQQPRLILPVGHTIVESVEYSPDGKSILTGGFDKTAKLWNAETGALLANFQAHKMYLGKVSFSPDGKSIASSGDAGVHIWNSATGRLRFFLPQSRGFDFTPDSRLLVTYLWNDTLKVWSTDTGKEAFTLEFIPEKNYESIRFSPDGRIIAACTTDSSVITWHLGTRQMKREYKGHNDQVTDAIFSPDASILVTLSDDSTAILWNTTTGRVLHKLKGHKGKLSSARFDAKGLTLLTIDQDSVAIHWDVKTGKNLKTYQPRTGISTSAFFSQDGKFLWTIGNHGVAYKLNAQTGEVVTEYKGHDEYLTSMQISPDGQKLVTGSADNTARVWDINTGDQLLILSGASYYVGGSAFSPDGKLLITNSGNAVKIWDTENLRLIKSLPKEWAYTKTSSFSGDSKRMLTITNDSVFQVSVWNLKEESLQSVLTHKKQIRNAFLSPDGKFAVSIQEDSTVYAWDVESGDSIWVLPKGNIGPGRVFSSSQPNIALLIEGWVHIIDIEKGEVLLSVGSEDSEILGAEFSPDGKLLATAGRDKTARLWDANSGELLRELKDHDNAVRSVLFSPDGEYIATTYALRDWSAREGLTLRTWRTKDGHPLGKMQYKGGLEFKFISFSADGRSVMTAVGLPLNPIEHIDWWDVTTGDALSRNKPPAGYMISAIHPQTRSFIGTDMSELSWFDWRSASRTLSMISIDSSDYISMLPDNYYMSTPGAAKKLHYVTDELKIISFEQLDVRFNRPDMVLAKMGQADSMKIQAYENAYRKRIKKLNIDTLSFTSSLILPESDFPNRSSIAYEQFNEWLTLRVTGRSSTDSIEKFNVWINESPVFGMKGAEVSARKSLDTTITIQLTPGKNIIETSVSTTNGNESYRLPLQVKYVSPDRKPEHLYFIGIGINQFAQPGHGLNWSVKDIRDLADSLKARYGNNITIDTLFDQNVTISNIAALKKKLLATTVNDKVIISYSGHGLLSKYFDYFLSTYNVNFEKPEEHGLPYELLEGLLDSIPARKKLMLIDACHSGEVDKEEMEKYVLVEKTLEDSGTKSSRKPVPKDGRLGMKNSFELMQEMFVNVGRSTGATVISAAAGTQFAQEKGSLQNGVFTYSILEYMKTHPTASVSELRQYVNKRVSELTSGMQVPTTRSETKGVDWSVW